MWSCDGKYEKVCNLKIPDCTDGFKRKADRTAALPFVWGPVVFRRFAP